MFSAYIRRFFFELRAWLGTAAAVVVVVLFETRVARYCVG